MNALSTNQTIDKTKLFHGTKALIVIYGWFSIASLGLVFRTFPPYENVIHFISKELRFILNNWKSIPIRSSNRCSQLHSDSKCHHWQHWIAPFTHSATYFHSFAHSRRRPNANRKGYWEKDTIDSFQSRCVRCAGKSEGEFIAIELESVLYVRNI